MQTETSAAPKRPKAIALMSGGLDSALAAKIVKDQGVEVIGLHLLSPFGCKEDVKKTADAVGIPLLFKEKGEAYLDLVQNPRYGYGRNMNPCIDCRIFMFQLADVIRRDQGADFVVTGEVLGQRPMSQQRNSMDRIDKNSPLHGLVLRPLSAHCMEPTIPENEGWVKREDLFEISGRSRKEQFALAEKFGIKDFSSPGGGCLLTEAGFSTKLKDFFQHPQYQTSEARLAQSQMLRFGRHFRFSDRTKVIVSRNEIENKELEKLWRAAGASLFGPENFDGPVAVLVGECGEQDQALVGKLIARYGKGRDLTEKEIRFEMLDRSGTFHVHGALEDAEIERLRI